ncbi:DUF6997 domain-containing protein [Candidatus Pyrohabitans sp.]
MGKDIFKPALEVLSDKDTGIYGPFSFQDYLKENNLPPVRTAPVISIDTYELLSPELKLNDTMVLRLGSAPNGTGTQFALVKVKGRLRDFFLFDGEIFTDKEGLTFLPTVSMRQLFGYNLLPVFTETSLVNLGLASGLISYALGLEDDEIPLAPATGRSTFTFKLKAFSNFPVELTHNNGQVEIDALFVGKRAGKETLFIIEAKSRNNYSSLAKHKLAYPILALAKNVPIDMPIIPVYVKVSKESDGIHYHVVECEFPDPRIELRAIDELEAKRYSHLILPLMSIKRG